MSLGLNELKHMMQHMLCEACPRMTKTLRLISIRYQSDAKVSNRCLINIDLRVFAIWVPIIISHISQALCYPSIPNTCTSHKIFNSSHPWQNGCRFTDDIFKSISLNEKAQISIQISLKFVPKHPINNIPALVQIMAWRQSGDKPLSEPMLTQFTDAYMQQ